MSFAQVQTLDVLCRHHIHTLSLTKHSDEMLWATGSPLYIYNRIDPFRAARLRLLITHTRTFLPLVVVYPNAISPCPAGDDAMQMHTPKKLPPPPPGNGDFFSGRRAHARARP